MKEGRAMDLCRLVLAVIAKVLGLVPLQGCIHLHTALKRRAMGVGIVECWTLFVWSFIILSPFIFPMAGNKIGELLPHIEGSICQMYSLLVALFFRERISAPLDSIEQISCSFSIVCNMDAGILFYAIK